MKKLLLILVGVALAAGIFAAAGLVYAAVQDPPETVGSSETDNYTPGDFRGRRGLPGGFGVRGDGILGDYMLPAIAEAFNLSDDQVSAFEKVHETIQAIREEFSLDEIHAKMSEAFSAAARNALADDAITQEQYDAMIERMEQKGAGDFGPVGGRGGRGSFGPSGIPARDGGILQDYLDSALAAALNLSFEDLQAMKADGLNLNDYAVDNDMTVEELQNLVREVHTNAIQAAYGDNTITEDQYQMMMDRLENSDGRLPFGPGFKGPRGPRW